MDYKSICDEILHSRDKIIALLDEMISIPSPTGKELEMAEWLYDRLAQQGFSVEFFDIDPEKLASRYPESFYRFSYPYENRPNVVGLIKGDGNGRSLMLNFHLDV